MKKIFYNSTDSLKDLVFDNMVIMVGGFGLCGIPENLIRALNILNIRDLTIISNNCGADNKGLDLLLHSKKIKKIICSYFGGNKELEKLAINKEVEVEIIPQGTLAERIRAGGAGIPAFYTNTGIGTIIEEGKERKEFNGKNYILERALFSDLSIIKAWKADNYGNLIYRKTARNFNPVMATAAKHTVAEVESIVCAGEMNPDGIHTSGIFVGRIVLGEKYEKPIEQVVYRHNG